MKEKEFGKLSRKEIREVFAYHYQGQQEMSELVGLLKDTSNEKFVKVLNATIPWSYFYELPYEHLLALFLSATTTKTQLRKMFRSKDLARALINWANSDLKPPRGFSKWTIEECGIFLSLVMAIQYNHQCVQVFGCYLNQFMDKFKKGDDNSLFNAILVDRSFLSSISVGKRISRAVMEKDGEFFDHLNKAIKGSRPKRPVKRYDDLRFMAMVLDESIGLDKISRKEAFDLLVYDLQLYPDEGRNIMKGFEKFIERILINKADMKT